MLPSVPFAYLNATPEGRIRLAFKVWRPCPDRRGRPVGTRVRWLLLELAGGAGGTGARLIVPPVLAMRRPAGKWVSLSGGESAAMLARFAERELRKAEAALN